MTDQLGSRPEGGQRDAAATAAVESWLSARHVRPQAAPATLAGLVRAVADARGAELSRNDPPAGEVATRQAAVLILLGIEGDEGPDVLLQERASTLRNHAGEISFPGGGREPGDAGVVETALREAAEETGLDPDGVDALAILPRLHIPPSRFDVTGVLAHWRAPTPVAARDRAESVSATRVSLSYLADPANRLVLEAPSGWRGPAFRLGDKLIWGYTGEILAALLRLGGWERPWSDAPRGAS